MVGYNDLATTHPRLAEEWDREKNDPLVPNQVLAGSNHKVWWRCMAGHTWQAAISSRARGRGCPYCAHRAILPGKNNLAATHPGLAAEWDSEKNGALTPDDVVAGTYRKAWWRCPKGHSYQAAIASRACGGTGCPVCGGKRVMSGR